MAAPKTANINVSIGGTEYIVKHSNFSSLSVKRTAKDVCDSFTLKILDDDAYTIEAALLSAKSDIKITYYDDDLNVYKELSGYALKLDSSFIDNRNMLSIEGLVSISINDKFGIYSCPWNTVPKFDWDSIIGKVSNTYQFSADYDSKATLDKISEYLKVAFTGIWSNYSGSENVRAQDAFDYVDYLFKNDLFSVDSEGNYYTVKGNKKFKNNSNANMEDESKIVKASDSYVIPIRPDRILKLLCCGGTFRDLLDDNYEDYKGTALYDQKLNQVEWYYIKKWFSKMGTFPGLGYKSFKCDYKLDRVEENYTQTKQSTTDFMYNTVLPTCMQTKDGKMYTNFYLNFDDKNVTLKRIDASEKVTNAPQYIYYGKFKDDGKNKGRMTSFSPKLDILTSMITNGQMPGDDSDISTDSLVYSGKKNEATVSAETATEGRYNVNWGMVKAMSRVSDTKNLQLSEAKIVEVFNKASELAYKASATIEGTNNLSPQEYIEIILLPKNETGMPTQHHFSGLYFIISIEDTIENGKFTSRLDLIKNVSNMGNTAAVQTVINENTNELKYSLSSSSNKKVTTDSNGNVTIAGTKAADSNPLLDIQAGVTRNLK